MYPANANVIIHFFLCFSGLCSLFCKYGNCNAVVLKLEEVIEIHPANTLFFQSYLAQKCKMDFEFCQQFESLSCYIHIFYYVMSEIRNIEVLVRNNKKTPKGMF